MAAQPEAQLSVEDIDRQLKRLSAEYHSWLRDGRASVGFAPAACKQRIDELLGLRFWVSHADDRATLQEWGMADTGQ